MASEDLYRRYIAGMNDADADAVAGLFAEDGVYVEPFTSGGRPNEIRGREAIRGYFEESVRMRPADMTVSVDRVDVDGETVRTEWTCTSEEWDRPMRGHDVMQMIDGVIRRLEVSLDQGEHL